MHRFRVLLRGFDLRQGWKPYGHNDCAEWLDGKCGVSRVTAQKKVRIGRALWTLPQIEAAARRSHALGARHGADAPRSSDREWTTARADSTPS
jgi:hypothetical protein